MSEIARITRLLEQTFDGKPYYGPSVLGALAPVTADLAIRKPHPHTHSIWELVTHLTAELNYAREVIEGVAGPWTEGQTTWPTITDTSEAAWQQAIQDLTQANRWLVGAVRQLDDAILGENAAPVQVPFYMMLHGTVQHNVYHAGQISLLRRHLTSADAASSSGGLGDFGGLGLVMREACEAGVSCPAVWGSKRRCHVETRSICSAVKRSARAASGGPARR